jgi:CheY-like chemotaxis protein
LRRRNFDFEEAENGEDGVKLFKQHPTGYFEWVHSIKYNRMSECSSVCLMDLQMPVLDGFQATTDIRRVETQRVAASINHEGFNGPLKVYALSGLASQEDKERASSLGFDG